MPVLYMRKVRRLRTALQAILAIAAMPLLADAASAQDKKQTAEGAQTFLSTMGQQTGVSRWLVVEGQTRLVNGTGAVMLLGILGADDVDEQGVKNPCVTRITKVDYTDLLLESAGVVYDRGGSAIPALPGIYATPLYVPWGKASINRAVATTNFGSWHTIAVQFRMPSSPNIPLYLRFSTQDSGLADRIEYATKFLQASCDLSADTGF